MVHTPKSPDLAQNQLWLAAVEGYQVLRDPRGVRRLIENAIDERIEQPIGASISGGSMNGRSYSTRRAHRDPDAIDLLLRPTEVFRVADRKRGNA